jgi:hypothetical protein
MRKWIDTGATPQSHTLLRRSAIACRREGEPPTLGNMYEDMLPCIQATLWHKKARGGNLNLFINEKGNDGSPCSSLKPYIYK